MLLLSFLLFLLLFGIMSLKIVLVLVEFQKGAKLDAYFQSAIFIWKTMVVISYKLNELILQLCSLNENIFKECDKRNVLVKEVVLSCVWWCEQHFDRSFHLAEVSKTIITWGLRKRSIGEIIYKHFEDKSVANTRPTIYLRTLVVHTGKVSYICWLKHKHAYAFSHTHMNG